MITSSRERGLIQESNKNDEKISKPPSSSRKYLGFRNPRIVRVSRAFGGKDRHSKVCTIKGLRDRRIRLSVPTAIQLYYLQDRLGLNQPSKVIDWLLDATKLDIDNLPPLQIPQGFGPFHQETLISHESNASHQSSLPPFFDENFAFSKGGGSNGGFNISTTVDSEQNHQTLMEKSRYWDLDATSRGKSKIERENIGEKIKWVKPNEQENQGINGYNSQISPQNFFQSFPGLPNNSMPYNFCYNWEPSNVYFSQFGSHGVLSQSDPNSENNVPKSYHLHSSNPTSGMPSNHSISFPVKFLPSSVNLGLVDSQSNHEQQSYKDGTGS